MKRGGRLSPTSKKRLEELKERPAIRQRVFERDGGCVVRTNPLWGPCWGGLTPHHRLKASQGGEFTEENLVTLCAFHNGMVEDAPNLAYASGLVVKSWEAS